MRLFLCTTALLALGGCSSMDLNHALGTPKNPTPTFRSLDAKDPATGEDEHLRKLYAELATADPAAFEVEPKLMRPYLSAGFALSDFYCGRFFQKTDEAYRRRAFGRAVTNDVGTVVQSVLNLANAGKDVVTGVGVATGLADSTWRHYDTAFLISADLSHVQSLVFAAQDNFRARTLEKNAILPTDYSTAQSIILRYANQCSFLGMQSLLNASATEKKQQLNNDTQTKTGEKPPATGGKPDDKKATEPPAGSAQPAIAPNKSTNDR